MRRRSSAMDSWSSRSPAYYEVAESRECLWLVNLFLRTRNVPRRDQLKIRCAECRLQMLHGLPTASQENVAPGMCCICCARTAWLASSKSVPVKAVRKSVLVYLILDLACPNSSACSGDVHCPEHSARLNAARSIPEFASRTQKCLERDVELRWPRRTRFKR